jgi:hypothetical protein
MATVENEPKVKVELAYPLEHEGTNHRADSTVSLPESLATELVTYGRARYPDEAKASNSKKEDR